MGILDARNSLGQQREAHLCDPVPQWDIRMCGISRSDILYWLLVQEVRDFETVSFLYLGPNAQAADGIRLSLFYIAGPLGTMFAGYFQSATYKNLNGVGGHAGWQWLFIVCGCITLPVAILGATVFPARPDAQNPSWVSWHVPLFDHNKSNFCQLLTQDQIELARKRMNSDGMEEPKTKFTFKTFRTAFSGWQWISFVVSWHVPLFD